MPLKEEEFGSHLEMIDSAFSMFSSIMVLENLRIRVEGMGEPGNEDKEERVFELGNEDQEERVFEEEKKRLDINLLGMFLFFFGVSDSIIEP